MEMKKEIRSAQFEAPQEEGKKVLEGYALVYNKETVIGSGEWAFREVFIGGCLDNADLSDVPLRYNHEEETTPILARTRNKSLILTPDEKGLHIRAELLDTQDATDMYKRVEAGLLDKMSIAFTIDKQEWVEEEGQLPLRRVLGIKRVWDVSIVDFPAYEDTSIEARKLGFVPKEIFSLIEKYNNI